MNDIDIIYPGISSFAVFTKTDRGAQIRVFDTSVSKTRPAFVIFANHFALDKIINQSIGESHILPSMTFDELEAWRETGIEPKGYKTGYFVSYPVLFNNKDK